jgi:16S rRNA (guanine1207-N2)-methyltransferase
MLSVVDFYPDDKVLDLGCGYGAVGILAAKLTKPTNVVMVDNDPAAVVLARENIEINNARGVSVILSDGFRNLSETDFTLILSNPPYHSDFSVPKHFIHRGFNRLKVGGRMYMVTKRQLWYRNNLTSVFGGAKVREIDGYSVFECIKRRDTYAKVLTKNRA